MSDCERHCKNCRYSVLYLGNLDQDFKARPNILECISNQVSYKILDKCSWDPALMPEVCGDYQPKLIRNCECCGDKMNIPEQSWPIWADCIVEEVACCSKRCKKKLEKEVIDTLKANLK